mmetsp:Transcript_35706/g.105539  ORF Transcript_35706/g.105539 Transcript_35706/m.105539 type:complete len:249 (-) Transcript_35706:903-1649(-)
MPMLKPRLPMCRADILAKRPMQAAATTGEYSELSVPNRLPLAPPSTPLPSRPHSSSELRKSTKPSFAHMCSPRLLYTFSGISRLTNTRVRALGRTRQPMSCLPVHSSTGLRMAGGGRSTCSSASDMPAMSSENSARLRKRSLLLIRKAHVRKSCVVWMTSSPFLGVHRLLTLPIRWSASARASSVCGRCRFISSPSKSALKGPQQHSLKRSVRYVRTRARNAWMDRRCRDGWRLKSTTSPSSRWRSTT